ncbi:MAG: hypothetical protein HOY69_19855 [Streptomyces sp.]|nr:hypothetical protein [Streptomyces sp.]
MTSTLPEVVEPSPVFVDESGRRGRRLRGLGWAFGVAFVGATLAMVSGLLGTQSDAPSFPVPKSADTLPPGQYVDAPQPAPPGKADRRKGAPHTAAPTASGTPTATADPTGTPTSGASADTTATATGSPTASPHHSRSPASASPSSHHPSGTPSAPTHESPTTSAPPPSGTPSGPAGPGTAQ